MRAASEAALDKEFGVDGAADIDGDDGAATEVDGGNDGAATEVDGAALAVGAATEVDGGRAASSALGGRTAIAALGWSIKLVGTLRGVVRAVSWRASGSALFFLVSSFLRVVLCPVVFLVFYVMPWLALRCQALA